MEWYREQEEKSQSTTKERRSQSRHSSSITYPSRCAMGCNGLRCTWGGPLTAGGVAGAAGSQSAGGVTEEAIAAGRGSRRTQEGDATPLCTAPCETPLCTMHCTASLHYALHYALHCLSALHCLFARRCDECSSAALTHQLHSHSSAASSLRSEIGFSETRNMNNQHQER